MSNISLNTYYCLFNEKAVICCFVHWIMFPYPLYVSKRPLDWSHAELHSPTLFRYLGGQLLQWHAIVATWIPSVSSYIAKETRRRWTSFTLKSKHDSSTETLLPLWSDSIIQTDTLQLLRDQKVSNRTAGFLFSLVSGQCNLQLFQYKIGVT